MGKECIHFWATLYIYIYIYIYISLQHKGNEMDNARGTSGGRNMRKEF